MADPATGVSGGIPDNRIWVVDVPIDIGAAGSSQHNGELSLTALAHAGEWLQKLRRPYTNWDLVSMMTGELYDGPPQVSGSVLDSDGVQPVAVAAGAATSSQTKKPQAYSFYDYDGTCGPDTSTSFLLYLMRNRPRELLRLANPKHLAEIARILWRYNINNNVSLQEGVDLLRRISSGFNMQLYSKEWASRKGMYETYEFIVDEWKGDLRAGRDVVILSSQSELGLANLLRIIGFEKIEIVGGEKTGASDVFQRAQIQPVEGNGRRIRSAPTAYILGTRFQMDVEGKIAGDLERWNHGEEKVKSIGEFENAMRARGIEVDYENSRAYFDKAYDMDWGAKVPAENRTIMNPKGRGVDQFIRRVLGEGSRVVQVVQESGENPGEKVIKTIIRHTETSPDGDRQEAVREIRQSHRESLTSIQRFAGIAVSPFQWFWGDLTSEWILHGKVSLENLERSAVSFGILGGVGSVTEILTRGGLNTYNRLPFFYAGPEIRSRLPAHFVGMYTALLVYHYYQNGTWDLEEALKGSVMGIGIHGLITTFIRGGLLLLHMPKGFASPLTLALEIFVVPPLEFYLMKRFGAIVSSTS